MSFERVLRLEDIEPGEMLGLVVCEQRLLLARVGDALYAYRDECPHMGVALSEGKLNGPRLICHAHFWEYDLTSGRGIDPASVCLHRFPLRVEDDWIWVDLENAKRG